MMVRQINYRYCWLSIAVLICINTCAAAGEKDETQCPKETDFVCHSDKKCIDSDLMCNKKNDCADGSDELNCECLEPDWYLCNDTETCISHVNRCDGYYDCPNNDDEVNCTDVTPHHEKVACTSEEFTCSKDNTCLPYELVCDGIKHCMDGSDESIGCETISKKCFGFVCKNKHCLTDKAWVCDGVNDCGDNSDEEQNCMNDCKLENDKFLCSNGKECVDLDKACNGKSDCSDGSDESTECQQRKNPCPETKCPKPAKCANLPNKVECICPKGYTFDETTNKCEDINECSIHGLCSQGCFNTAGSYECKCVPHFKLEKDNRTCTTISTADAMMVYAAAKAVKALTLRNKHSYIVADKLNQVIGVSYDGNHVYWTDISIQIESIMRAREDGADIETLFTAGLGSPEDIAVDFVTGNMYFTDNSHQHVAVCSNDGRHCKALITDSVDKPRAIALHPRKGKMYWSDWGKNAMIAVASMDGAENKPLVTKNIHWPNGLALDWPNDRLYWVDAKLKSIESIRLDGTNRQSVIKGVSKHPYAVAVFENSLYWSDWDSKSIQSCDKFTGKHRKTIIRDQTIYGVHIYHQAMHGFVKNKCKDAPCSHLCLLNSNDSYTCACPKYMELAVDKHTCKSNGKQKILLIGVGSRFVRFEHQSFGRHDEGEGKFVHFHIDKMAFNSITGDVLVADNQKKVIYQMDVKSYVAKELLSDNVGLVTAMAFDNYANNLYWACAERSTVEVYSFNTHHRAVVHHFAGNERPIALTIVPEIGKLFIALQSDSHTHIDLIEPHGRGKHFHVFEDELGKGHIDLVTNHHLKEVFWSDFENNRISFTDFDGNSHHTFLYDVKDPVSLAFLGDDIFWTTKKSLKLSWAPIGTQTGIKTMRIQQPVFAPVPQAMILQPITALTVSDHTCASVQNGGCSHVCVALGKTSHACLCPAGMVFQDPKNITCIEENDCYFRCYSGECVSKEHRCDGVKHCADRSDEENCGKQREHVTCAYNQFRCADGKKCIDLSMRCNNATDCNDKSDESDCEHFNRTTQCHDHQFVCSTGACIDYSSVCDGIKDCEGGSDEINCEKDEINCGEDFKCTNGQCIKHDWVCDGSPDCTDSSDENHCHLSCPSHFKKCEHGLCLDASLWCDGNNDCGDFSDEVDCVDESKITIECGDEDAHAKKFQCKFNKTICLDTSMRCDGKADCPKGEDELDCTGCTQEEFQCANHHCIPRTWRCDSQKDCADGSDETNCNVNATGYTPNYSHYYTPACSDDEYKCKNNKCVDFDRLCNQENDCGDNSDENGLCDTACKKDNPCDHVCSKSPNGPVCKCKDGYELAGDKRSCHDINECASAHTPCAQNCYNTVGSFKCSCLLGFSLATDKRSCKSLDSQKFFFYSAYDNIYRLGPHLSILKSANGSKITALDMNFDKQLLYFTIEDADMLYELNWNNSQMNSVANVGSPSKIAVDWVTDNVYFIENAVKPTLKICHLNDTQCITLLKFAEHEHIKTLAVDPINRRFFYSITKRFQLASAESLIYMHNLDGTNKKIIANNTFTVPSLTCDFYNERIYYIGLESRTVWSVNYDGTEKHVVIASNEFFRRPIEISLIESHIYVLNRASNILAKCRLYGDRACSSSTLNVNHPSNYVIAQKSRQKFADNVCSNHKCKTICLAADTGSKCVCDYGVSVVANEVCNNALVGSEKKPTFQKQANESTDSSGSTTGMIIGTISLILLLVGVAAGGLFIYKRHYMNKDTNIRIFFENPRNTLDKARVKMSQLNEIILNRQSNVTELTTMDEENQERDIRTISDHDKDDSQRLLP